MTERVEDRLKNLALGWGTQAVGIASADEFSRYAPEGYRPSDLLPGAKSVIVFGGQNISAGAWRSLNPRLTAVTRTFPATRRGLAMRMADWLEKEYGSYSIFYDAVNESHLVPFISLKLAAELAGLGTRAMAGGVILHPQFGLLSLSCTITTLELTPDGKMADPVCPDRVCLEMWERQRQVPCLQACPTCLSGEIEDGRIKWMQFERHLCAPRAQTTGGALFQRMLYEMFEETDSEKRKALIFGDLFTRVVESNGFGAELVGNCYVCAKACPVVTRARTLIKPTSGGNQDASECPG